MAEVVSVEGFRDLDRALKELPRATGKNVARRTLRNAGQPIADAAAAAAPVDQGHLRDSYAVSTKLNPTQRKQHRKRDPVEMFIGTNDPAGVQTEFGNIRVTAQPHFRPVWDAGRHKVLQDIQKTLGKEIQKSAERLARKAAKAKA